MAKKNSVNALNGLLPFLPKKKGASIMTRTPLCQRPKRASSISTLRLEVLL